jgi:hypothetical protein
MKKYITIRPWNSNAPYQLEVKKDDFVTIRKYDDRPEWKDWIWCETSSSSGFIPHNLIEEVNENTGKVLEDYTAKELGVGAGEVITGIKKHQGWVFGINDISKEQGWLPNEILLKLKV